MEQLKVIPSVRVGKVKAVIGVVTPEASIEVQKQKLLKYCEQQRLNPIAHFEDIAAAGSFNRPGFNEMLAFIGNNEKGFKHILVTHWDRFSRNACEAIRSQAKLKQLGIEVIAISQSQFTLPDYLYRRNHNPLN